MAKKNEDVDLYKHPDGHALIDGARWHYPKTGSPSECAIAGCDRVLTRHLRADIIDEIEADDTEPAAIETEPESVPAAG
jgi:hypothetical protein